MRKKVTAIFFAVLAAALYAVNMPFSKLLLGNVPPTMMAAFLYLGAGTGIGIIYLFSKKENTEYRKIEKKDIKYIIGMIVLDIIAPILLMSGLSCGDASSASLLSNFEIVATSLIALIIFKEVISFRMWCAIALVTLASFFRHLKISVLLRFQEVQYLFCWLQCAGDLKTTAPEIFPTTIRIR